MQVTKGCFSPREHPWCNPEKQPLIVHLPQCYLRLPASTKCVRRFPRQAAVVRWVGRPRGEEAQATWGSHSLAQRQAIRV